MNKYRLALIIIFCFLYTNIRPNLVKSQKCRFLTDLCVGCIKVSFTVDVDV